MVKLFSIEFPLRQEPIHKRYELAIVGRLQQVNQFVNNHLLEVLWGFLGQLRVEPNRARRVIATPPFGLHPTNIDSLYLHTNLRFPLCKQSGNGRFDLLGIPCFHESLSLLRICSRTHTHVHAAVFQLNRGRFFALGECEQITFAPYIVLSFSTNSRWVSRSWSRIFFSCRLIQSCFETANTRMVSIFIRFGAEIRTRPVGGRTLR